MSPEKRALLIAGPTASGKSALALDLARRWNGVIINADAMQVYSDLRILTARPLVSEESQVPHRLYGHVGGGQGYSVARWLEEVSAEIARAWEAGQVPIVTGGTGLYFRALERGLAEVPEIPGEVRTRWREHTGDVYGELMIRDPAMAQRLLASDRQRIVRALEVIEATGRSLLDWQQAQRANSILAGVVVERIYMEVPRDELYARAEQRFDLMLKAGALAEVAAISHLDPVLPVMKAIGVPELAAHLRGEITLEDAAAQAKTATRNYIKRQLTWWRGQMKHWQEGGP
ncbi:MAG: tRNA (adenosine(37)-N6)-dimethylallyltransferase MiaA [Alphaproteobacteria bacterium]|nr:tRNA (adenosine(37)-N6)-dimethylallyltransferase MiaA [Alphaproteobacteria bacterium]